MQKKLYTEFYEPAEDTIFLTEHIKNEHGKYALDMGTGSGFLAEVLSRKFEYVVATDINHTAIKKAKRCVENCICCNAADPLVPVFDLVICNTPYLPSKEILDPAVDGLKEGIKVGTDLIISASKVLTKNGKLVFLTSSFANYSKLIDKTIELGFSTRVLARKKLFFEELVIIECLRRNTGV